jgi:hypothetical protein
MAMPMKITVFSDMRPCIWYRVTNVSEETVASIFRVKEYVEEHIIISKTRVTIIINYYSHRNINFTL